MLEMDADIITSVEVVQCHLRRIEAEVITKDTVPALKKDKHRLNYPLLLQALTNKPLIYQTMTKHHCIALWKDKHQLN